MPDAAGGSIGAGGAFGELLRRAAAAQGQELGWRAYVAFALALPTLPEGLLAEVVPHDPAAFAAAAARYGVDPFLLLWLVKEHLRGSAPRRPSNRGTPERPATA